MLKDLDQVVPTLLRGFDRVEAEVAVAGFKWMLTAWWMEHGIKMELTLIKREE